MKIIQHPSLDEEDDRNEGTILAFVRKQLKKHPDLRALVEQTMESVERAENLDALTKSGVVSRLTNRREPLYEFRIPPGKRRGGVVRIYFAYHGRQKGCIVLLNAEFKKVTRASAEKLAVAEQRFRESYK